MIVKATARSRPAPISTARPSAYRRSTTSSRWPRARGPTRTAATRPRSRLTEIPMSQARRAVATGRIDARSSSNRSSSRPKPIPRCGIIGDPSSALGAHFMQSAGSRRPIMRRQESGNDRPLSSACMREASTYVNGHHAETADLVPKFMKVDVEPLKVRIPHGRALQSRTDAVAGRHPSQYKMLPAPSTFATSSIQLLCAGKRDLTRETHMLSPADNERLTRVGPGTPMGNLFRRYWIPALLAEEVPERRRRAGARAPARRRSGRVSRQRRRRSGSSTRSARTAARRCSSAATKSAVCAASTTAGNSTATAPASTCRRNRRTRCSKRR